MAAVVLAAGAGTRLAPLTGLLPKPLCPLGGEALLDQAVARARTVTPDVAVNVHNATRGRPPGWGRDLMLAHLAGSLPGVHVSVEEDQALGTAGALGRLKGWIDGRPVLVVNADAWHRADLATFAAGWDGRRVRLLTVLDPVRGTWGDRQYAGAALLPWSEVERLPATPAGLWEASWRHLVPPDTLDLVVHRGAFFDCGTPAGYLGANLEWSGGAPVIGRGAEVRGTVEASVVWAGARVEQGEHLWRAVRATEGVTVLVR